MTRIIAWAAVLILNLVLGASLLPEIAIGGILPDITLLLVFSAGFLRGSYEGAFVGMAAGFLYDIFFGTMLGANGLILMLLGALAGRAAEGLRGGGFVVPVSLGGIFSLLYNAVIYVAFFMFSGDMGFIFYFIHLMLPAAIYSAAVALPIFGLVAFINSKIAKTERRRTNLRYYSNVYNTYGEKRRRY